MSDSNFLVGANFVGLDFVHLETGSPNPTKLAPATQNSNFPGNLAHTLLTDKIASPTEFAPALSKYTENGSRVLNPTKLAPATFEDTKFPCPQILLELIWGHYVG